LQQLVTATSPLQILSVLKLALVSWCIYLYKEYHMIYSLKGKHLIKIL